MARIRSIHPNFWDDDELGALTPRQRLLFIAAFSGADDFGRINGSPKYLKGLAFRYDSSTTDADVQQDLRSIASVCPNFIWWMDQATGRQYIEFAKWSLYQHPRYAAQESRLPTFDPENDQHERIASVLMQYCVSTTARSGEELSREERSREERPADEPQQACGCISLIVSAFADCQVKIPNDKRKRLQTLLGDYPWFEAKESIFQKRMIHDCAENHVKKHYSDPLRSLRAWFKNAEKFGEDKSNGEGETDLDKLVRMSEERYNEEREFIHTATEP
jgi:hypothetical protein